MLESKYSIVNVLYRTCEQTGPDDWKAYTDVYNFGLENTLGDVAQALYGKHFAGKEHVTINAEIVFHLKEGE
jgi:hypothetical protein